MEEPNDFMDILEGINGNEKSYSLYNRGSKYLSNPLFEIQHYFLLESSRIPGFCFSEDYAIISG